MGELKRLPFWRSRINPGWTARRSRTRPVVQGLTPHLCPQCKFALGETDGKIFLRKCPKCEQWVLLKKC